ncbi:e3 ubiquitin ligase ARI4 [Fusarium tjaetaba]|uniref:RBR-type E3 ubiquitin transferase n=1 Tax=Fusarium tjaetaba TaxID=1567544 RepID=A0A8H5W8T9_9HYPO|nr:e3 ubiquitin ligase ARI4 [Fusarium tjaetaba]KAF5649473.1 e3 ubiquitin ligase ARI4 [Fusarium tjaetaba]
MSDVSDALDRVHPDFLDLLIRLQLLPPDEAFSEPYLARLISIALDLAEDDEQAFLVSRIITDEELALDRLRSPEVRNTNHRIVLDRTERRIAFREAAMDPFPEQTNGEMCVACLEDAQMMAPCGEHNYCYPCYRELIRLGLSSQEGFPPRCCEPIDEAGVALARAPALIHLFRQVQEEANAPIHDRLYCHDPNCAAFIPPDRNGRCLLCVTQTCRDCGERGHPGQPCREGAAEEDVWATMDENKTVNCPGCGRMIELAEACNHMTCVCGQEFCFICGEIWRTCGCPTYGGFNRMVPMRDRPGTKPPQYRRRPHPIDAAAAADEADGPARIPQLRPIPGEEERVPPQVGGPRRVIRPLVSPRVEEAQQPQEQDRRGAYHGRERQHGEGHERNNHGQRHHHGEGHHHHHHHGERHHHHHHHGERYHHGERRHHDEIIRNELERERLRRRAELEAPVPMGLRRETRMVGRPPAAPLLAMLPENVMYPGNMGTANQGVGVQREHAPGMRMDRRRDDGGPPLDVLMPGMGRLQINEPHMERPPVRDERAIPRNYRPGEGPHEMYHQGRLHNERDAPRRPYNPMDAPQIDRPQMFAPRRPYNPMDAPQMDRPPRVEAYLAVDAEARRTNQNRLLAMNREAARLAEWQPPRQQGRNRPGHHGAHHDDPILIDSDDDLYGDN